MTRPRRTTSSRSPPPRATRAASASSGATSSTAPPCSPPRGAAPACSTSPPPASSIASSTPSGAPRRVSWSQKELVVPAVEALDDRCWTDIGYCDKNGVWYPASKALAEKAAWKFAEENGLDVVGNVFGEMIPPKINSMAMFLRLVKGCAEYADFIIGPVHVEDVALAQNLLYENASAFGRHLCMEPVCHWSDFAAKVTALYPDYKVPKFPDDTQPGLVRAEAVPEKLMALGLQFSPVEKIIRDAVESLRSRGCIA